MSVLAEDLPDRVLDRRFLLFAKPHRGTSV